MGSKNDRNPQRSPRHGIKPVRHRHLVPLPRRIRPTASRPTKTRKPKIPKPQRSQSASVDTTGPMVVTEGFKDAAAGTLVGGIPTGAIAGVSHYRQCLKQGSNQTIVFDADGWTNPAVFAHLAKAAQWVNGKVALVPQWVGEKAGLVE
jgi:hypothetical protein